MDPEERGRALSEHVAPPSSTSAPSPSPLAAALRARVDRGGTGFIPYLPAGYPDLDTTVALALHLARLGADAIELGVPFSDPVADGPAIQQASQHALAHGVTMAHTLEAARAIAAGTTAPVVLMTYVNPVLAFGAARFAETARDAGVRGVILTDLPWGEDAALSDACDAAGIARVLLIAPTTPAARRRAIAAAATGFVYVLSRLGITGGDHAFAEALAAIVADARAAARAPVAVGFGVARAGHAAALRGVADAVVVGSAIVRAIAAAQHPAAALHTVTEVCMPLLEGLGRTESHAA